MSALGFKIPDEIQAFLDSLNPSDTGYDHVGAHLVFFEGFTDMCLEDFRTRQSLAVDHPRHLPLGNPIGHTLLEQEILSGWEQRLPVTRHLESGWTGYEENPIFFAIYEPDPEILIKPIWKA